MRFIKFYHLIFFALCCLSLSAKPPQFDSITKADLEMKEYAEDKEAVAVYLLDWCEANIDVYADKPLTVKKHFRIKILKPQALDYATIKLISYTNRIPDFKASTFNLEDGKIIETKLSKKDVFAEKRSKETYNVSFAFNNVKVGSVIECSYSMSYNDVFDLYPWEFQHDIPVVSSEFTVIYPGVFQYKYVLHAFNLNIKSDQAIRDLRIGNMQTSEITLKFSGKNLPAFEPEPYMASKDDALSRVEFELGVIDLPAYRKNVTPTYAELSEKLLNNENFGGPLKNSTFLINKVKEITKDITSETGKIEAIRHYIIENVKWNEETGIYTTFGNFKKVLKLQNGSIADINLLLVAMLRKAGFSANPVILSTRENGALNKYYAIISKFNYVLAYVRLHDKDYLIDATNPSSPFNELPFECLNGQGRIISLRGDDWIDLKNNENIFDQVLLNVSIGNDESLIGNVKRFFGSYSAHKMRKTIREIGEEAYLQMLKQSHGNWEFSDLKIENLDSIGKWLTIQYNIKAKNVTQQINDLCIINPVIFFNHNENPFPNNKRKFPIDFGCAEDELYTLNFSIPQGYALDEYPANINLKLPNDAANFIFKTEQNNSMISIMYRYKRKQNYFESEEYVNLREFFNQMIKKQSELIILKKVAPISENINDLKSIQ
jgi:transglutaminase-like putative cysteine protease